MTTNGPKLNSQKSAEATYARGRRTLVNNLITITWLRTVNIHVDKMY